MLPEALIDAIPRAVTANPAEGVLKVTFGATGYPLPKVCIPTIDVP